MKIIFFGTADFAVSSLEAILGSRHKVVLCVTQPDRQKGRALKTAFPPVKEAALKHGLTVAQPQVLDDTFAALLKSYEADLFVVIAYGNILKDNVLSIPKKYSVNLHGSLLPKYRGAAPINWAVINNEPITGVTVIRLNERMDGGDIISKASMPIEASDDSASLTRKLADIGARLLVRTLDAIDEGKESFSPQKKEEVTFARKLKKEDGIIDWTDRASDIHNKVRGMIPWPGAYVKLNGQKINIWRTSVLEGKGEPGVITDLTKENIVVGCGEWLISILSIQLEGKKVLSVGEFLRGYRNIKKGDRLL